MIDDSRSDANASFWNELCGTNIAKVLGLNDQSPSSIEKFDTWFFNFYPYLIPFLNNSLKSASNVLEVGLGYGSVASHLAKSGYLYTGLDIADGPVAMCEQRLNEINSGGIAVRGDALNAPFEDNTFDAVVAIGSLHHTGDFDQAIREMVRVTVPGGIICGMVYSVFSARNFIRRPFWTTRLAIRNLKHPVRVLADERLRWFSDHNQKGEAAPSTEYFSRSSLRLVLENYGDVQIKAQNLDSLPIPFELGNRARKFLIKTRLVTWFGLDLYYVIHQKIDAAENREG